ncbi:hypothetical protein M3Y98_01037600 [Aphelenchoides besseyi]|nr:hypothetical protein M3Y98_01037600 [Aphelenchoides besseyi]KAI6209911.1 hypothetical protein M3Y96_00271300 [Aphelenchoides besseyi]
MSQSKRPSRDIIDDTDEECETCCRHGTRGCGGKQMNAFKGDRSDSRGSVLLGYMKSKTPNNEQSKEDEKTIYENQPTGINPPDCPSSQMSGREDSMDNGKETSSLLNRFYLGVRTKADAQAAITDRDSFGIYHAIPFTHYHMRSQLKRGNDLTVQVRLELHMVHRRTDGKFEDYPIRRDQSGTVFVDFGNDSTANFRSIEGLLAYHSNFMTGKLAMDKQQ